MADESANSQGKKGARGAASHIKKAFSSKKTSATSRCLPKKLIPCTDVAALVKKNNKCKSEFSDELIICQIFKESTFNVHENTKGKNPHVGFMQMNEEAIKAVNNANGTNFTLDDMNEGDKAIQAGTLYLCLLKRVYKLPDVESTLNEFRYGPKWKGKPPKGDKDEEHYAQRILRCEKCLKENPAKCVACTEAINPPHESKPSAKRKHASKNPTNKSKSKAKQTHSGKKGAK